MAVGKPRVNPVLSEHPRAHLGLREIIGAVAERFSFHGQSLVSLRFDAPDDLMSLSPCLQKARSLVVVAGQAHTPHALGFGRVVIGNFARNFRRQLPDKEFLKQIGDRSCANPERPVFEG